MNLTTVKQAPSEIELQVIDVADGVELRTTSLISGINRTEIAHTDDDYSFERERVLSKMTPDGLRPLSTEECEQERSTTKMLLKKFGTGLIKLDSNALSFPVIYSEPRSYLERCTDVFSFLVEEYIQKSINEPDPIVKLAYIATGIIAALHIDLGPKKVFNPILGETYHGHWENGTEIFAEQSSHHPPVSDIEIYGPDKIWKCFVHMDFNIDTGINTVDLKQNGVFHLEIKDGPIYEWKFPTVTISGFVKGDRVVKIKGEVEVLDITNNLICSVDISPRKDRNKGLENPVASTIYGGIKVNDRNVKEFAKIITGDYGKEVLLDGDVIWDIANDIVHRPVNDVPDESLLPSDCRFRFDRALLIQGKIDEADRAKTALEELQRREEKLRESISLIKTGISTGTEKLKSTTDKIKGASAQFLSKFKFGHKQ